MTTALRRLAAHPALLFAGWAAMWALANLAARATGGYIGFPLDYWPEYNQE